MDNEKRFVVMFDGTDHSGMIKGTAAECGRRFLNVTGGKLKLSQEDEGLLEYLVKTEDNDEYEFMDSLDDEGSMDANLEAAYAAYFKDYICPDDYADYRVFEINTSKQEALFKWTFDELLDHITARELRDAALDYDEGDDFDLRCWYYENKLA